MNALHISTHNRGDGSANGPDAVGQGQGADLVARFEAAGQTRGCTVVTLESCSFQAPGVYLALGYTAVHTNTHFPHGLAKLLTEKPLVAATADTASGQ